MSEDCHDSTGGKLPELPNAFERKVWTCDICGATESAYNADILDLRAKTHVQREHKVTDKPVTAIVPVDINKLVLTVLDIEWFRQLAIKVD